MEQGFGEQIVAWIVGAAGALVSEGGPGWVALALATLCSALLASLLVRTHGQERALAGLRQALADHAGTAPFNEVLARVERELRAPGWGRRAHGSVATALGEYRETLIHQEEASGATVRNVVRPAVFFNLDDLGFGPGWFRILPNLFVAVGLFLTFLGLIAALSQFQARIGPTGTLAPAEMAGFLGIAAAKFIMSLTGLACSILFSLALRWRSHRLETELREVNAGLERGLSFLSQEDTALQSLREQQQTRSILQGLATDIATKVGEAFAGTIGQALRDGIAPVLERLQTQGTEGVGSMVASLSERLSGDVGRALGDAAAKLDLAAERLGQIADRLADSGAAAGNELEAAGATVAAQLQTALAALETRAGAGASALETAAKAVADLLGGLEAQIGAAGRRAEAAVGAEAEALLAGARDRLMSPVEALAERLAAAASAAEGAGAGLREAASGMESSGAAARAAAEGFVRAARDIGTAAQPFAAAADRIEQSNRAIESLVRESGRLAAEAARSAAAALETLGKTLSAEGQAIAAVLERLREITDRLQRQGAEMDRIDALLGQAFDRYTREVQAALDQLQGHVQQIAREIDPALDRLREVVEQVEQFRPSPWGGRS